MTWEGVAALGAMLLGGWGLLYRILTNHIHAIDLRLTDMAADIRSIRADFTHLLEREAEVRFL